MHAINLTNQLGILEGPHESKEKRDLTAIQKRKRTKEQIKRELRLCRTERPITFASFSIANIASRNWRQLILGSPKDVLLEVICRHQGSQVAPPVVHTSGRTPRSPPAAPFATPPRAFRARAPNPPID